MMKLHIRVLGLALLLVVLVPAAISAQSLSERETAFCGNQKDRQDKVAKEFTARLNSYENAVAKQGENKTARRVSLDEELATARGEADIVRNQSYELIKEKQSSAENKALAEAYSAEVDTAISVRRAAYDEARVVFHQALDDLLNSRDRAMKSAISDFQSSANTAMNTASSFCSRPHAGQGEARRQLLDDLKNARVTFAERLRARQDFRTGVKDAIKTRDKAFRVATEDFQKTMQTIREKYSALRN